MTSSSAARARAAPTTRRRSRRTERTPNTNDIVDIWWSVDKTFYRGRLTRQYESDTAFRILYDDGEREDLDLVNEYWKFADDNKPPPPDTEEIVDVVLDGSHQGQLLKTKPQPTAKKPKPKPKPKPKAKPKAKARPAKVSASKPRNYQPSDDERDKDYVAEEVTQQHTTKQKRPKSSSDRAKKRPKKTRKQSTTSDKTSSASRVHPKTGSDSRRAPQQSPDQPESTSHLSPQDHCIDNEAVPARPDSTSSRHKNVAAGHTDSKHTAISRDGSNAVPKNDTEIVDVTPSPPSAPNTQPTFHIETPHEDKSQKTPKLAKTNTGSSEMPQPREAASDGPQVPTKGDGPQVPTKTLSTGTQRLTDTVATSRQKATLQNTFIDNQRDLAITRAEPSLLPTASAPHAVTKNDDATPFGPHNQASAVILPSASGAEPARPASNDGAGGSMIEERPDKRPSSVSVPVKVAIRPRSGQGNVSGSGASHPNRTQGETSTDHSGIPNDTNTALTTGNGSIRKRSREDDEVTAEVTDARVNGDSRPKRSKNAGTEGTARPPDAPDGVIPLTHFPEHDPTLATLVNRRLNPIERHLRSLSEDLHLITGRTETQRELNDTITETVQRSLQDIRKEVHAIREEVRSAQADRRKKHEEILKLLQEMKENLIRVPTAQPAGELAGQQHSGRNRYNMGSPNYQRIAPTPGAPPSVPHNSTRRNPIQDVRPVLGPPLHEAGDPPDAIHSDHGVNVSPRRVAGPLQSDVQAPADMNANKFSHPPSGRRARITNVVARQITVWLLETPHEYEPIESRSLNAWARQTSAAAFVRVADRLSHFEGYTQAYQTLSTSLGNDAVEMSWFTRPEDPTNVLRARRNYAAWDPPPSDSEWESEVVLLVEIAKGFQHALENHTWRNEDDLAAAVIITKGAAGWYNTARCGPSRHPSNGNHGAISQAHRATLAMHHNGPQFIRTPR